MIHHYQKYFLFFSVICLFFSFSTGLSRQIYDVPLKEYELVEIPQSLSHKLGSGELQYIVSTHLKAKSQDYTIQNIYGREQDKIAVAIYFEQKPASDQLLELRDKGIQVLENSWTPPVGSHPLGYVLAYMPPESLVATLECAFVERLDSAEFEAQTQNNSAATMVEASYYWGRGYDGSANSVRVAVLDAGIDDTHPDFSSFEKKDYSDYPTLDDDVTTTATGHGTHVAGTVLGLGTQSQMNTANTGGPYKGMAPGADMIFLKIGNDTNGSASTIAMYYALEAAATTYSADVINLSYGGWDAYHDGSHILAQKVDDIVYNYDIPVIIAAGNNGDDRRHYSETVPAQGESGYIQVNANVYSSNTVKLKFNTLWYDGTGVSDSISLEYYDSSYNPLSPDKVSHLNQTESTKGTEHQISYYDHYLPTGQSTYYLKIVNFSDSDHLVHIYEDYSRGGITFENDDYCYTVSNPGLADNAFTVGATISRESYVNYLGDLYSSGTKSELCSFSGRGPRVDGVNKPDIIAPGRSLISVRDRNVYTSPASNWVDNDGQDFGDPDDADYVVMSGTSMATPVVTGSAALILDENPGYSASQVYDGLREYADLEDGIVAPDDSWGYGILDLDEDDSTEPVAVTLSSFQVTKQDNAVSLEWTIETKMNHAGFHVLRSSRADGGYEQINERLITTEENISNTGSHYAFLDKNFLNGPNYYKLHEISLDGSVTEYGPRFIKATLTDIETETTIPLEFALEQNYPNPFNPSTTVEYSVAEQELVEITVYNMMGQKVRQLVHKQLLPGHYTAEWRGRDDSGQELGSGMYLLRMSAGSFRHQHKITLLR